MQVELTEDIYSYTNNKILFGKKGEIVTVIEEQENLYIVEGKEKYSVLKTKTK